MVNHTEITTEYTEKTDDTEKAEYITGIGDPTNVLAVTFGSLLLCYNRHNRFRREDGKD